MVALVFQIEGPHFSEYGEETTAASWTANWSIRTTSGPYLGGKPASA